jgi:hypothetical protein
MLQQQAQQQHRLSPALSLRCPLTLCHRHVSCPPRYGGGLTPDGAQFRDSNVLMPPVYVATYSPTPGLAMLDFYILIKYIGFCSGLLDAGAKLLRLWSSKAVCSSP